ncbi:MAG: B12-binding domain-containing protein [Bacteroidales bacterium]
MTASAITDSIYNNYLNALLAGNRQVCHSIVKKLLDSKPDIKDLYVHLFQRSLYEVGELWEKNKISVATEHIATAITEGLLTLVYPTIFAAEHSGKKGLVACVPNEFHQIGAKMVADTFELNGWDGYFIGSNTPVQDLIKAIDETQPDVIALSLSIYFNLPELVKMMQEIRKHFNDVPIWVGGQAFRWGGKETVENFPGTLFIDSLQKLEHQLRTNL